MRKKACATILMLFLMSVIACADGGFFRPLYYSEDIYEPTQKAVILHNAGVERLILEATYQGNITDFAWVVPTPNLPKLDKAESLLFEELHYLTQPTLVKAPRIIYSTVVYGAKTQEAVTVHEQKQVGIYEATVLSSDDPDALVKWLNNHSYRVDEKVTGVIGDYVNRRWYFTAFRVNLVPGQEKLLESLRKINPSINSSDDALNLLADQMVDSIRQKRLYSQLDGIPDVELDYGEVDEGLGGRYGSQGGKPTHLIEDDRYTGLFEAYNGYLPEHMASETKNSVVNRLNERSSVPGRYYCNGGLETPNVEYCGIWYFTKESPEYKILKDVECGKGCKISGRKDNFTIEELAGAAARAALDGNPEVIAYFSLNTDKPQWYYNSDDMLNYYRLQVEQKLSAVVETRSRDVKERLKNEIVNEYSLRLDSKPAGYDGLVNTLTEAVSADLAENRSYMQSQAYALTILDNQEYIRLQSLYSGDGNEYGLRRNIRALVEGVLDWNIRGVQEHMRSGTIQPIMLTFESKEPVYPLKISSVNAGSTEILLYVFTKHQVQVNGFTSEYGKWIETKDAKSYKNLNGLLDDRYYLTKMRRQMWPREMTSDLILKQAADDEANTHRIYEENFTLNWILFTVALAVVYVLILAINIIPALLNNRVAARFDKPPFKISVKRFIIYAMPIPVVLMVSALLGLVLYNDSNSIIGAAFELVRVIPTFGYHLLNLIGIPDSIAAILVFLFFTCSAAILSTVTIHVIYSLLTRAQSELKARK